MKNLIKRIFAPWQRTMPNYCTACGSELESDEIPTKFDAHTGNMAEMAYEYRCPHSDKKRTFGEPHDWSDDGHYYTTWREKTPYERR